MILTKEQLAGFKKLYEAEFGETLSDKEALEKGLRLITLVKTVVSSKYENEKRERRKNR